MSGDEIDYDSPMPPYRQIAEVIIGEIKRGVLLPDKPIPSEATLIQRFGVARDTVRRCVRYLREQGWIFTVPQRGSYVADRDRWPTDDPSVDASD